MARATMLRHLGYVAIAMLLDAPTNRTCRLRNATPERLRALVAENLGNLGRVLAYNVAHDIRLYRITSDIVPFASHPVNRLAWWEEFAPALSRLGAYIRRRRLRVSMHPGPFTVLNSTNQAVADAAADDVRWHRRFLDALGTDRQAKIVVHIGSMTDGREASMTRFVRAVERLPAGCRARLIVENDDRLFTAEDALAVSRVTALPVVFDWLHHRANAGRVTSAAGTREVVHACFETWRAPDGIPKVHLSSPAPGGVPGQHGDWVRPRDVLAFLDIAPARPFDAMLEAKRKDQALLRLRRQLARLGVTETGRRPATLTPAAGPPPDRIRRRYAVAAAARFRRARRPSPGPATR